MSASAQNSPLVSPLSLQRFTRFAQVSLLSRPRFESSDMGRSIHEAAPHVRMRWPNGYGAAANSPTPGSQEASPMTTPTVSDKDPQARVRQLLARVTVVNLETGKRLDRQASLGRVIAACRGY